MIEFASNPRRFLKCQTFAYVCVSDSWPLVAVRFVSKEGFDGEA